MGDRNGTYLAIILPFSAKYVEVKNKKKSRLKKAQHSSSDDMTFKMSLTSYSNTGREVHMASKKAALSKINKWYIDKCTSEAIHIKA